MFGMLAGRFCLPSSRSGDCAQCQRVFPLALLFAEKKRQERTEDLIMERQEIQSRVTGAPFVLLPLRGSGVIAESITEMRINYSMS